ncbi:hypothetical protein LP419_00505 [Massilia sp. H-1]|nr:hypothetical protein LP419_00505 [Massilia sp. H-1]
MSLPRMLHRDPARLGGGRIGEGVGHGDAQHGLVDFGGQGREQERHLVDDGEQAGARWLANISLPAGSSLNTISPAASSR